MTPLKDIDVAMLCGNNGIQDAREVARTHSSVTVFTHSRYGHSMRPALTRTCQSLTVLVGNPVVYAEEVYPEGSYLTFNVVR